MTKLTKPVRRKIDGIERRGIVVTLYPNATLGFRAAKTRTEHVVPVSRAYRLACEVTIEAKRKAREKEKAEARKAKGLPPLKKLVSRGLLGVGR